MKKIITIAIIGMFLLTSSVGVLALDDKEESAVINTSDIEISDEDPLHINFFKVNKIDVSGQGFITGDNPFFTGLALSDLMGDVDVSISSSFSIYRYDGLILPRIKTNDEFTTSLSSVITLFFFKGTATEDSETGQIEVHGTALAAIWTVLG